MVFTYVFLLFPVKGESAWDWSLQTQISGVDLKFLFSKYHLPRTGGGLGKIFYYHSGFWREEIDLGISSIIDFCQTGYGGTKWACLNNGEVYLDYYMDGQGWYCQTWLEDELLGICGENGGIDDWAWICSSSGKIYVSWVNCEWQNFGLILNTGTPLNDIDSLGDGCCDKTILCVGNYGKIYSGWNSWFFGSSGWCLQTTVGSDLHCVTLLNDNNAWTAGTGGKVFYYDGLDWSLQTQLPNPTIWGIYALNGNNVFACGENGEVWNFNGSNWSLEIDLGDSKLQGVSGINNREVWVVSDQGEIFHGINPIPITPTPISTPSPTPSPTCFISQVSSGDYNGDGTSDIAIFRGSSGLWAIRDLTRIYFGTSLDIPASGDYDGDGTTDVGIFRYDSGLWAIRDVTRAYFGNSSDTLVPLRFNPSSACNIGIFRESTGLWAIKNVTRVYFGGSGDLPVPGDYNGDGTKELGIFRESSGLWALREVSRFYFGESADTVIPGSYGGEGTCSAAIFRGSSGLWAIRGISRIYYGQGGDWPVPADYKGEGKDLPGVFRDSSGLWAIRDLSRIYFGTSGDMPVTR